MGVAIIITLCVLMNLYFCYNQHQLKKELTQLASDGPQGNHDCTKEVTKIKVMIPH